MSDVLVAVRVKPMGAGGGGVESSGAGLADGAGSLRFGQERDSIGLVGSRGDEKRFACRQVVEPTVSNEMLYNDLLPVRLDAFFAGVNVNVMCYGMTGTGKTHTTFGSPGIMARASRGEYGTSVTADYGLFPRALLAAFDRAKAQGDECVLTCSAVEISLLGNRCMIDIGRERVEGVRQMEQSAAYGISIDKAVKPPRLFGMVELVLETKEDLLRIFAAIATRNTAGTGMNDNSSRTHCFCFLKLYRHDPASGEVITSRFQFVDLAGSERLEQSTGSKDFRESWKGFEGLMTNLSLMELSKCVRALVEQRAKERKKGTKRKPHSFRAYLGDLVPLLCESMTGRALTAIFVCVSQAPANASQTANTLDFGTEFAKLDVREQPTKPVSIAASVKKAKRSLAEAEAMIAKTSSPKYIAIRRAQALDARQTLEILGHFVGRGSAVVSGGGRARKK